MRFGDLVRCFVGGRSVACLVGMLVTGPREVWDMDIGA